MPEIYKVYDLNTRTYKKVVLATSWEQYQADKFKEEGSKP